MNPSLIFCCIKERSPDEQKEENKKLKVIIDRHKNLIPKIQETLVKTECYWKCYSYGDDLIPIFEFIDDLRNRSVKEIQCGNSEMTEEHIEKQDKVLNSLENKRKMVMDFIAKGEKLMTDPNCPKFLDGHVKKLREAWEDTNEKAQVRKKALTDNLNAWSTFEEQKVENHKQLDAADAEFDCIKKIFDLVAGPNDYNNRMKTAANFRKVIQDIFDTVSGANDILQVMLPDEKKSPMTDEVKEVKTRMEILGKTDGRLDFILDFNKRLAVFNQNVTDLEGWLEEGRKKLDSVKSATEQLTPEDRVTKSMEFAEDLKKKSEFCAKQEAEKEEIFPKQGEKVSSDAKKFIERLKSVRSVLTNLDEEIKSECAKFSEDVKYFAEFQTGIKAFDPWMKKAEQRISDGLMQPKSLVEACEILGTSKNFQDECEAKIKILEEAATSALKMTTHNDSDGKVDGFRERWTKVHEITKEWVARMTTLVECWNKLDGNVGELSSWVNKQVSFAEVCSNQLQFSILRILLRPLVSPRSPLRSWRLSSTRSRPCSRRSRSLWPTSRSTARVSRGPEAQRRPRPPPPRLRPPLPRPPSPPPQPSKARLICTYINIVQNIPTAHNKLNLYCIFVHVNCNHQSVHKYCHIPRRCQTQSAQSVFLDSSENL